MHKRGGPEELVYQEAPRPSPQAGDALVRVYACAITPTELSWQETYNNRGAVILLCLARLIARDQSSSGRTALSGLGKGQHRRRITPLLMKRSLPERAKASTRHRSTA